MLLPGMFRGVARPIRPQMWLGSHSCGVKALDRTKRETRVLATQVGIYNIRQESNRDDWSVATKSDIDEISKGSDWKGRTLKGNQDDRMSPSEC